MQRNLRTTLTAATVAVAGCLLATTSPAVASSGGDDDHSHGDARTVRLRDDCDPVTFNAALGDGACSGDGDTTFQELFESLVAKDPDHHWRIAPRAFKVRQGRDLRIVNTGGEFHTFTEVPQLGAGCVPQINDLLGLAGPPVADCAAAFADPATALPAGGTGVLDTRDMSVGTHYFECVIHPWMVSTVTVRKH